MARPIDNNYIMHYYIFKEVIIVSQVKRIIFNKGMSVQQAKRNVFINLPVFICDYLSIVKGTCMEFELDVDGIITLKVKEVNK